MDEYRGLWIFAEQYLGRLSKVSLELLGKGAEMARRLEVDLTAVLLGHSVEALAKELIANGADRVIVADHPRLHEYRSELYTRIIADQALKEKPEILVIGATPIGRELTPRIAYRLRTGCTADCTELDVDVDSRGLVSIRPAFGGNIMATILCPEHRPQMSTVRPGVLEVPEMDANRTGSIEYLDVPVDEMETEVEILESTSCHVEGVDIREVDRIVSIGMGAGDKETFDRVAELAEALDAGVAASRLAVEAGWMSHDNQVGQTGKTVRPQLYVACGISGAVQHTAGMNESKCVVAINKNPDAEIFEFADYGIVGDIREIVPAIIKEIQRARGLS
jgi:electron transfer flavoprotein alpha subunit